jgi:phage protein U
MLFQLGDFIFERTTLAPNSVEKSLVANWPKQSRYGGRPAVQFTGIESETLTLSGVIFPLSGVTGTAQDLDVINQMIADGEEYLLMNSEGDVIGTFCIISVTESRRFLDKKGLAQKIEFNIALERTDNDRTDRLL